MFYQSPFLLSSVIYIILFFLLMNSRYQKWIVPSPEENTNQSYCFLRFFVAGVGAIGIYQLVSTTGENLWR